MPSLLHSPLTSFQAATALSFFPDAHNAGAAMPAASGSHGVVMAANVSAGAAASAGGVGGVALSPAGGGVVDSRVVIPSDGSDDWEIDSSQLKLHHKIASGSFGDL